MGESEAERGGIAAFDECQYKPYVQSYVRGYVLIEFCTLRFSQ